VAPTTALGHVNRVSAVAAWAMLLLLAGLSSLAHGARHVESLVTGAGIDHAVAAAQRQVSVAGNAQQRASGGGHLPLITACDVFVGIRSSSFVSIACAALAIVPRICSWAQPRAPPHH
jgi:hypothetical protein